ncbi:Non-reducing end alpha-L-arabinofuranosidase BoGH43A [Colletotrichum orbiculare MAFF 240422]|uniref:Non-reducing end alpha-L-arabinofuranosidase BoGH43A n=1 Tax=Colletotrichum orbiculare (strain 104-T / ATCC 96160 / CBS 514.97 / LARS 414 / MAFF 240422) TaxID=1213857 RepID=N4VJ50_COLOR|nr:Non-reducing end alpha-L-arabinofuranosidase BoGH43A [Colletotrichum orbiculare MAFF 240422]
MAETRKFRNPVIPGFAPDPSVIFVDGVFYLATSSFHVFPGIPIYASTDLQEWKHIGNAINRKEQLSLHDAETSVMPLDTGSIMVATAGLFAPTIRHHKGTFHIICTNATRKDDTFSLDNFYISTTDIWSGTWSDPIHFDFSGIDPSLFFDDDGRVYVQGCWMIDRLQQPSCTIKQFEIDIQTGRPLSETREIWGGFAKYDTEGPHIYKHSGYYYLLVAEGGTFEHHLLSIGRSRSIWGPYESCESNPIMTADGKPEEYIQNIGHGELFQDRNGRESFLTSVDWPEGGWPTVKQPRMEIERRLPGPVGDYGRAISAPADVDWVYIRDPDFDKYVFDGEGDNRTFKLCASQSSISSNTETATFVGKRQRSLNASASVTLDISGAGSKSVSAGLALYKDALRHVSLAYDFESFQLIFDVTTTSEDKEQRFTIPFESGVATLRLRVETSPREYTFFYRGDENGLWEVAGKVQVANVVAREMTGPIFGLFAQARDVIDVGKEVLFERFLVEDS